MNRFLQRNILGELGIRTNCLCLVEFVMILQCLYILRGLHRQIRLFVANATVQGEKKLHRGAEEACWAHNPKVLGSKPSGARYSF